MLQISTNVPRRLTTAARWQNASTQKEISPASAQLATREMASLVKVNGRTDASAIYSEDEMRISLLSLKEAGIIQCSPQVIEASRSSDFSHCLHRTRVRIVQSYLPGGAHICNPILFLGPVWVCPLTVSHSQLVHPFYRADGRHQHRDTDNAISADSPHLALVLAMRTNNHNNKLYAYFNISNHDNNSWYCKQN